MIVAHCLPRRLPDMLLRIQIWRCHRKLPHLHAWVGRQHLSDLLSPVPRRPVPQQQDRHVGIGCQELLQVPCTRLCVQCGALHDHLLPTAQVQRSIEAGLRSSWVAADHRALTTRSPHAHGRGLQIQRGLVLRQDDRLGCILCDVDQVFSSKSSNAMTWLSWRDLYTFCVRWKLKSHSFNSMI